MSDLAQEHYHSNMLKSYLRGNREDKALKFIAQATAEELFMGEPAIAIATQHGEARAAMAIINKEGVTPQQLLAHYRLPRKPSSSSNSLNDAILHDNPKGVINALIDAATPQQLVQPFKNRKTVLDAAIHMNDEEVALKIVQKSFGEFTPERQLGYIRIVGDRINDYAMPQLLAEMQANAKEAIEMERSTQRIKPLHISNQLGLFDSQSK